MAGETTKNSFALYVEDRAGVPDRPPPLYAIIER